MKEFIKIEKRGNEFTISEKQNGRWLSPQLVSPVSKADIEKMLAGSIIVAFTGLGNNIVALIKVHQGWHFGNFHCNTGYWLASLLGPIELHKE